MSAWGWIGIGALIALAMGCFAVVLRAAERDEAAEDWQPVGAEPDPYDGDAGRGTDDLLLDQLAHLDFEPTWEDR